jgi:TRAP-type uncharacterized transport system substrate-binding protein
VGLAALGLAVYFYFHNPEPSAYHLRLTAGNPLGMRHHLAVRLRGDVAQRNITLDLVTSSGSEESLDMIERREVDAALIQGALTPVGRPNVRQVATLHVEPMHLLVKKELFKDASASLTALRGKIVDLDQVGSGTHTLARAILEFVGLRSRDQDPDGGYFPVSLDRRELFAEQETARLPDAVFLVSSLPSPTVSHLATRHGFRLVPLPFAEAFALRSLVEEVGDRSPGPAEERIAMGRIQSVTIPAFTYGVEPAVPEKPIPTLGARLLLVAHKDVPSRAVLQMIEAIYSTEFGQIVRPPLDPKLMDLPPEFPWHEGALHYQQRNAPLLWGQAADWAHKGLAIVAATASGLFVLWQWTRQYGQRKHRKGFNRYIAQVARIEEQVMRAEQDGQIILSELLALQDQLCRLKIRVLDEFARDELTGSELLTSFLAQVNHAGDYLARVILRSNADAPALSPNPRAVS